MMEIEVGATVHSYFSFLSNHNA